MACSSTRRMIEPGDWTGPGGAGMVLGRADVDVAVLETARGGILLRGVAYQSNEASVLTNVTSDHLHLQGIHTLRAAGRGEVGHRADHASRRLGGPQRRRSAGRRGGPRCARARSPCSRSPRRPRPRRRCCASTSPRAGAPTWSESGRIVEAEWRAHDPDRRGRDDPDHARWHRSPQRRQRTGGRGGRPRDGRLDRAGGRRPARLPARRWNGHPGGSTCSGWGGARSSWTTPTTRPASRPCWTSPRASPRAARAAPRPVTAIIGDRGRPARRRARGDRPDRGDPRPAGRDQGAAPVPPRPRTRERRRRTSWPGIGRAGVQCGRGPGLRGRDRGAPCASWRLAAARGRDARCAPGHRDDLAPGATRRMFESSSPSSARARSTVRPSSRSSCRDSSSDRTRPDELGRR